MLSSEESPRRCRVSLDTSVASIRDRIRCQALTNKNDRAQNILSWFENSCRVTEREYEVTIEERKREREIARQRMYDGHLSSSLTELGSGDATHTTAKSLISKTIEDSKQQAQRIVRKQMVDESKKLIAEIQQLIFELGCEKYPVVKLRNYEQVMLDKWSIETMSKKQDVILQAIDELHALKAELKKILREHKLQLENEKNAKITRRINELKEKIKQVKPIPAAVIEIPRPQGDSLIGKEKKKKEPEIEEDGLPEVDQAHLELLCTNSESYMCYIKLIHKLNEAQQISQLISQTKGKEQKMVISRLITSTINCISDQSSKHLLDKYNKLYRLISGQMVEMAGKEICIGDLENNRQLRLFSLNLIAKQLVAQADEQVSSRLQTAFPFAVVAAALITKSNEFRDLLYGYFYKECPYLIPYYPPRLNEQTDEEYYQSCGYRLLPDGRIEDLSRFIIRHCGFARLYAAVMITQLPNRQPNPLVSQLWKLLAEILNLRPRPVYTATILHSILTVAGGTLFEIYGRMFTRLLKLMSEVFIPRIKHANVGESDGGAAERLESLVTESLKTNSIEQPDGLITDSFW